MTTDAGFDPNARLPGPPDPWASTDTPARRSGPPYHMTDMIAAEPAVARRILANQAGPDSQAAALATAIATAARAGRAVIVTGCGTSEHAALGTVDILREAARAAGLPGPGAIAAQAFELSLDPPADALVIGVSHEGGTTATNAALAAARDAGSQTALLTVSRRSPGAAFADLVVETHELDQGWCHVVGYTSPMLAAAAIGAHLSGRPLDGDEVAQVLAGGSSDETGAERIAGRFADAEHLIVIGSGADRPSGRELTLKVEEASWLPSAFRDLETFLHGHLPATGPETALVLILADRDHRAERAARAVGALRAARGVGIRAAAILAADLDGTFPSDLTPAGRILVPEAPSLPAPVAALFGAATALQLLTERVARARGTDPDPIRRDDPRYKAAADAADG
jgi:fructoselysine-6-P-deglycase FrlB-like protein